MSFQPRDVLRHILDEADYLIAESQELSENTFCSDPRGQRAFVRSLEVIGEAAKLIPKDFRAANPHIDRRGMAGMRSEGPTSQVLDLGASIQTDSQSVSDVALGGAICPRRPTSGALSMADRYRPVPRVLSTSWRSPGGLIGIATPERIERPPVIFAQSYN
jgi:hypothetical protein